MNSLTYENILAMLEQFSSAADDPDDPKARKRLAILDTAAELFTRQGYRRTSVDQIALHAGIAKGTVYLYFKNKSEILIQAIVEEKKVSLKRLIPIFSGDLSAKERLRQYLKTAFLLVTEMPLSSKLLSGDFEFRAVLNEIDADVREKSLEMGLDMLAALIRPALTQPTPDEAQLKVLLRQRAQVVVSLFYCSGLLTDPALRGTLTMDRFAEILADLLVSGLIEFETDQGMSNG